MKNAAVKAARIAVASRRGIEADSLLEAPQAQFAWAGYKFRVLAATKTSDRRGGRGSGHERSRPGLARWNHASRLKWPCGLLLCRLSLAARTLPTAPAAVAGLQIPQAGLLA